MYVEVFAACAAAIIGVLKIFHRKDEDGRSATALPLPDGCVQSGGARGKDEDFQIIQMPERH